MARKNNQLDYHHILFQRKHWQQGWAKTLREHPYCGGYIPQNTLHRAIHAKLHDIPTPNGRDCRIAVEAINNWLDAGYISLNDTMERKLEVIGWCFRAKCPATIAMLDCQREIIAKFYNKGG